MSKIRYNIAEDNKEIEVFPHLNNVAKTGELVIIDTNILSKKRSLTEELYTCYRGIDFDHQYLEKEMGHKVKALELIVESPNIMTIPEVIQEEEEFLRIINESTGFHLARLNKSTGRKSKRAANHRRNSHFKI